MKSLVKFLSLLALMAVLFVSCDNLLDNPNDSGDSGSVYRSVEDVKAVSTSEKAVLSWTKPEENWFGVKIGIAPEVSGWDSEKIFKDETSILVENLSSETEYTFTFTTVDKDSKNTDKTALLKIKTPAVSEPAVDETVPANVTNLVAKSVDGGILLTWTDAVDEDIFGYEITYSENTAARAIVPMEKGSIFVSQGTENYLVTGLGLVIEYNFTVKTMDISGNKSSGVSVTELFISDSYEPFANLTEDTAHPMKYVVDFADLVDFVKGKDTNVSEDGIFTVGDNEEYGDPDRSDRQTYITVTEMFKNNMPKAGDVIEVHGKFTSDIDIDNMSIGIVDDSIPADYWWRAVKDVDLDSDVSKDEVNEFKIECPVLDDYAESISFVIAYGKHNADGAFAKLKFEHCIETKVEPMDAPAVDKKVEAISDASSSGIQLKINMEVPETAVTGEVVVYSAEDISLSYTLKFDAKDKAVDIPYVTAGKTYYLKLKYFDKDSKNVSDANSLLRVKAESGKVFENAPGLPTVYEVDFTPYINAAVFPDSQWCNILFTFDTQEVYGGIPKVGDIIEYTIRGKFSIDVEELNIFGQFISDEGTYKTSWGNWNKSVVAMKDQEIEISGTATVDYEPSEKSIIGIGGAQDKFPGVIFIPEDWAGTVYEVDLTDYLNAFEFGDWNENEYGFNLDVTDAFEKLPNKDDIIKYTFTGIFSEDISNANIYFDTLNDTDRKLLAPGWNIPINAKAGQELKISRTVACDGNILDKILLCISYRREFGRATFISKDWKGNIYEIDFTDYLESCEFYNWGDEGYGYAFDVTKAFKTFPKKGDLIKYIFTGTYSTDIDVLSVNFDSKEEDRYYTFGGNWNRTLNIQNGQKTTISGYIYCEKDANEMINLCVSYNRKFDRTNFTPAQ